VEGGEGKGQGERDSGGVGDGERHGGRSEEGEIHRRAGESSRTRAQTSYPSHLFPAAYHVSRDPFVSSTFSVAILALAERLSCMERSDDPPCRACDVLLQECRPHNLCGVMTRPAGPREAVRDETRPPQSQVPEDDKLFMKEVYKQFAALRGGFSLLLDHVWDWVSARLAFADWSAPIAAQEQLWRCLGLEPDWCEELIDLGLRFDDGRLLVANRRARTVVALLGLGARLVRGAHRPGPALR